LFHYKYAYIYSRVNFKGVIKMRLIRLAWLINKVKEN
jgi:hypothetical protein